MGKDRQDRYEGRPRYRLLFVNEWKGRTVFSLSMPLWAAVLVGLLLLLLTSLLAILIVVRSPLKAYLPGYLDVTKRAELVEVVMRLDSLEHDNQLRSAYLVNMTTVLSESRRGDTIAAYDSAFVPFGDSLLLAASAIEEAFRDRYEQQERFGLGALGGGESSGVAFLAPVAGRLEADTAASPPAVAGWRVTLLREAPVLSPFDGTVVLADYVMGQGYKVAVLHTGDYLVVLSRLTRCLAAPGEVVKAGQALGHAGAQPASADRWVGLEVWHKGRLVNPENVMQL